MHEIICPHCDKAFKIDETGYADILKQVHDSEFEQQLHERLELAEKDKLKEVELAKSHIRNDMQEVTAAKDASIKELEAKLDAGEVARKLAVTEALRAVEKEHDVLAKEQQGAAKLKDEEILELKGKLDANEVGQKLAIIEAVGKVEKERDELKNGLIQSKLEKEISEKLLK
ncbi:MAG: DUF2130 domain-containing protein, partial [Candidatus Anammoxibacter sp.]